MATDSPICKPVDVAPFKHLYPFESHFLKINGLRYHYLNEGRGEPVLMVHGNPTWSFYFRSLVAALSPTHQVVVPDHIGCGLSDKPEAGFYDFRLSNRVLDLSALMDHLNLGVDRPVTLIVHDWGGMIGLAWALDHLNRLGRLVITNTAGFFPPGGAGLPLRLRLLRKSNPLISALVLRTNLFARAAVIMAPRSSLRCDVRKGLLAPYNCPRNRLATLKFVQDIPLCPADPSGPIVAEVERRLSRLKKVPVLILWGGGDFVFTRAYYERWRTLLPHAEAHYFSDAGHYLLEDAPRRVAKLVSAFLQNNPLNGIQAAPST